MTSVPHSDHVLYPQMNIRYPEITKGEGVFLFDSEGKRYIDAAGGPVLCSLGYGLGEMGDVLRHQSSKINFSYRMYSTTSEIIDACSKISGISGDAIEKTMIVCGGTEAVEMAAKVARTYHIDNGNPQKYKVIGRWISYHGMSNSTLSWGGHLGRRKLWQPFLFEHGHIPPAYCYRCWFGKTPDCCGLECACALEREIQVQGPETVSAFIAEPYSGNSLCGAHPERAGYFQKIREICDKYDVLMIMDEVMTGVGRTGDWFAYQGYGVKPDIVTMGKALGGGYFPVGGIGCSKRISDVIESHSAAFAPGFSWAGNPMAGAVISATIAYKIRNSLLDNVNAMGDRLMARLRELADRHPTMGDVRGKGLLIGIEFVKDKDTKACFDPALQYQALLVDECREKGMFIQSGNCNVDGTGGDMLLLGPAFIITAAEIDEIIDKLDEAVSAVEKRAT